MEATLPRGRVRSERSVHKNKHLLHETEGKRDEIRNGEHLRMSAPVDSAAVEPGTWAPLSAVVHGRIMAGVLT